MKTILLLAPRNRFSQMLCLELHAFSKSVIFTDDTTRLSEGSLLLFDADVFEPPTLPAGCELIGYTKEASRRADYPLLHRPFPIEELHALLSSKKINGGKEATGEYEPTENLTKIEEKLLSLLLAAEGEPVSREALSEALFPKAEAGEGSVTVYIHYLRRKLEKNGERLILSHRGKGYSIKKR